MKVLRQKTICDLKFISKWLQTGKKLLLWFLASVPQLNKISFLPAFIYVDAAIDHAHKEIMSLGFDVSRWARTLIRKSIELSIGPAVFGKGLQSKELDWSEKLLILKLHSNIPICRKFEMVLVMVLKCIAGQYLSAYITALERMIKGHYQFGSIYWLSVLFLRVRQVIIYIFLVVNKPHEKTITKN